MDGLIERLAYWTVLSAVFLPLTVMAGVWGMNFSNMPELERRYAYFYAIGSMVGVGVVLMIMFWRCGCFV